MEYLELELEVLLTTTPSTRIRWKPGVQWNDEISNHDQRDGLCPQRTCTLTSQCQAGVSPLLTLQLPGTLSNHNTKAFIIIIPLILAYPVAPSGRLLRG